MRRPPENLAVLRQRDFRLVFGAFAMSVLGDRMVTIALTFAVLELGGSASDVGLVPAARTLPLVASLLVGGVVADRVSRRAVMVVADLARVATQGLLAALLIVGAPPIWAVATLSGLTGAATGFFSPASTGLLPAVVAPEHLQQANGLRATAMSGGEIAGPALAGVLAAAAGPGWALGIDDRAEHAEDRPQDVAERGRRDDRPHPRTRAKRDLGGGAYDWFVSLAFNPVGFAIWGPIAAAIGIEPALWVAGALLLSSILAPLAIRDVRELPGV